MNGTATPEATMGSRIAKSGGEVRWVGSKGAEGVWQRIISEMPPIEQAALLAEIGEALRKGKKP